MPMYKLNGPDDSFGVVEIETGASIPADDGNRHWREYREWRKSNTPLPQYDAIEEAKQAASLEASEIHRTLAYHTKTVFKMFSVLYQVGRAKNLWTKADFEDISPEIIETITVLKARVERLEEIERS